MTSISINKGFITITNHNEHNGYYGGFGLAVDGEIPTDAEARV